MKKYLALGALVVVGALSGRVAVDVLVDDQKPAAVTATEPAKPAKPAKPKPAKPAQPKMSAAEKVVNKWVAAIANHRWQIACSLETPAYAGPNCPGVYNENFSMSEAQLGFDIVQELHIDRRVSKSAGSETFRAVGPKLDGAVLVTVEKQMSGRWLISGTDPA